MRRIVAVFSTLQMIIGCVCCSSVNVISAVTLDDVGEVETHDGNRVRIGKRLPRERDWHGEELLLEVVSGDGDVIAQKEFYSSYGKFHLELVDLTCDGQEEYLLVRGVGRGTSARREYLEVMNRVGNTLSTILTVPVSEYYGSGAFWKYRIDTIERDECQRTIRMSLMTTPPDSTGLADPELIPEYGFKEYRWDRARNDFKLNKVPEEPPP